jgi:ribosomal protein S15P/S13E
MSKLQLIAIALLACAQSVWSIPALAQAERLPDKEMKRLIDQVDERRDKFEGNLDDQFKNSTVRGSRGEVNVSNLLQDYQDNTKKLQDRFKDDFPATAEATTVLRQATDIDRYMKGTSEATKGRKEWDAEAVSLRQLAEAYGATFPLPAGATLRRINDKETAAAADAISSAANRFKDDVDNNPSLSPSDKDAGKKDVDLLVKQADVVKDHVNDSKPATADARQLVQQAARIQAFADAHRISTTNWERVRTSLGTVRKAFGLTE